MTDQPQHLYELTLPTGEDLEIWRLPAGGVVGIDTSFLEQVEDVIQDPYNAGEQYRLLEPMKDHDVVSLRAIEDLWGAPAPGLHEFVELQTCDEGLWFEAKTAPEAYLQQELRKLHDVVYSHLRKALALHHGLEEHIDRYSQLECMHGEPACFNCIGEALAEQEARHENRRTE